MKPASVGALSALGKKIARKGVKTMCLDTNVLIHDPGALLKFAEHNVCIPVEVIEELDHLKQEQHSERGRNARAVTRKLAELFPTTATMREGVRLPNGGFLLVIMRPEGHEIPVQARSVLRDLGKKDNLILATALYVQETFPPPVSVISKDANLLLKARAIGINAEDYKNDKSPEGEADEGTSFIDVDEYSLQRFASEGRLTFEEKADLVLNEYVLLRAPSGKTMPARAYAHNEVRKLNIPDGINFPGSITLRPRNIEQRFLLDALLDPTISLVIVRAKAGTGKTLLTLAAALKQVVGHTPIYDHLHVSRAIMPLGKQDVGFLPGSADEKMAPGSPPTGTRCRCWFRRVARWRRSSRASRSARRTATAPTNSRRAGTPPRSSPTSG